MANRRGAHAAEKFLETDRVVRYHLVLDEAALSQLRALPKAVRRNIGRRLDLLQDSLQGDVKKLTGEQHRYRLRIGAYRALFRLDGPVVHVYAVKQRKEAYE